MLRKTNVRVYAFKSDDDSKTKLIQNLKENQQKPMSRVYAFKSDDDSKNQIDPKPKRRPTKTNVLSLCL